MSSLIFPLLGLLTFSIFISGPYISANSASGSSRGSGSYDKRNIFDQTGHQRQLDYAEKAIYNNAGPLCCVQVDDGILFITSKKRIQSKLVKSPFPRTMTFDDNRLLVAAAGLAYDGSTIFTTIRQFMSKYRELFPSWENHPIPIEEIAKFYSKSLYQQHDLYAEQYDPNTDEEPKLRRIPGVNLLLAGMAGGDVNVIANGVDRFPKGKIYLIRPDGSRSQHRVAVQGQGSEQLSTEILAMLKKRALSCTIDELLRDIKSSDFIQRHFAPQSTAAEDSESLEINDHLQKEQEVAESTFGDDESDFSTISNTEMYVMYTSQAAPASNAERSSKNQRVVGTWQLVDIRSLLSSRRHLSK